MDRVLACGFNGAQFTKAETGTAPQFQDELEKEFARNAACSALGAGIGKALGAISKKAGCMAKACTGFFKKKPTIPTKAKAVLEEVLKHGKPPKGYVGGRVFQNREGRLPVGGKYREYDVDPRPLPGGSRNAERIVVDETTGRAWYTDDHYGTFIEIK